jgi:hypothetical protein
MNDKAIFLSLKRFLLLGECPPDWQKLDLYLFRDENVVFYVGQSHFAFARVWEHLLGGFHGHSIVGRFVWCNWPVSMNFTIELMSSKSAQFGALGNDVSAAERELIRRGSPCFNVSQNSQPSPVPPLYLPYNAQMRCSRSLTRLVHQARRAAQAEDRARWMRDLENEEGTPR